VKYLYLWRTELVRNSDLVMKPVRYKALEKSKGGTVLFLPSSFTGSPVSETLSSSISWL